MNTTKLQLNLLLIVVITLIISSCAAPGSLNIPKNENGIYEYQGVIEVDGKSQSELFDAAKEWIAINFRSAQDVIQLDDRENGQLIAKGYYPIVMAIIERHIYLTLRIETRDGRFRYTINDFEYHTPGENQMTLERAAVSHEQGKKIDESVAATISSLTTALKEEQEIW